MRGHDTQQAGMFSYLSPEERVPATSAAAHPALGGHGADRVVAPAGDAVCQPAGLRLPRRSCCGAVAAGALQAAQ